jgi:hypothetical protein
MPTLQTLTPLLDTDFLDVSRVDINENFDKLNTLGDETTPGLVQLATNADTDAELDDVVLTPANLAYKLINFNTIIPINNTSDIGAVATPFGAGYFENLIVLNGSEITIVAGELFVDGSPISSGGGSGITIGDVLAQFVSLDSDQDIINCTKTLKSANLVLDPNSTFTFEDATDLILPLKGSLGMTVDGGLEIVGNTELLLDGGQLGTSIGTVDTVGKINKYRKFLNIEKQPDALGSATYVDLSTAGTKSIYLSEQNAGQTIYVSDNTTNVFLPPIYDSVNSRKLNGTKFTFIKTNDSSDLTITASTDVYSYTDINPPFGTFTNGPDMIGDADDGEVTSISTSGTGTFHTITIEAVSFGSLAINGDYKSHWVVTSKTGSW